MTTYAPVRPRAGRKVVVDPRIRARRVAVVKEQGRRRLRRVLWVLGALGAAAAATGAVLSPLLDINRIEVQGVDGVHAGEVRRVLGIERGEALLLVDTGRAAANVEGLTWVDDVQVERRLPGTLRVEVIPRFPVAFRTSATGGAALLDRAGAVISEVPEAPPGVPRVTASGASVRAAARVAAALSPTLRPRVWLVTVRQGRVEAALASGVVIRFGDGRDARAKVVAAEAVLRAIGDTPVRYVDVSVPSAPVTG